MNKTSLLSKLVNNPAKSPGLSITGPEETFNDIKDLADGIHLTAERLMNLKAKKFNKIYGASCHNKKEIIKASNSKLDYCFLGPVQKNIYKN